MNFKKIGFLIAAIPMIIGVIYLSRAVVTPFIFAFFLAYALNPMVEFLQYKGARRDYAILTVYLIMLILAAIVWKLLVPRLIHDLTAVIHRLPQIFTDFQFFQFRIAKMLDGLNLPFNSDVLIEELTKRGEAITKNFLVQIGQGAISFFAKSLLYILIPLIAYYFSRDYPQIKRNLYGWVLRNLGNHWTRTFLKIDALFKFYIRGQLLDTFIVGSLFAVGLSILGFEAAILLGFVAALFNLIPYFGPVLGALPIILFALLKSPWLVLYVVILFLIVNQLEVMVFAPRIMSYNLGLHPITVIYLILVGGELFGLVGMIFAVPLGAIFLIIIKSIYEICFGLASDEPFPGKTDLDFPEPD